MDGKPWDEADFFDPENATSLVWQGNGVWIDMEHAGWMEGIGGRCWGCGEPIESAEDAVAGQKPPPPGAAREVGPALKRQALELGYAVFVIVRRYVAIRKTIFRVSLRAIIPLPGIFRTIDFEAASVELYGLAEGVGAITTQVSHHLETVAVPPATRDFLTALEEYSGAVSDTIAHLLYICGRLQEKSAGVQAYPWSKYRSDVAVHNALAKHYGELGARVSSLHARLDAQQPALLRGNTGV